ncbi:MAG: hypothetical protein ACE15F_02165 [bacterium]
MRIGPAGETIAGQARCYQRGTPLSQAVRRKADVPRAVRWRGADMG